MTGPAVMTLLGQALHAFTPMPQHVWVCTGRVASGGSLTFRRTQCPVGVNSDLCDASLGVALCHVDLLHALVVIRRLLPDQAHLRMQIAVSVRVLFIWL